jgi:4-hydroxyphenylpyruvate dioxygenase
MYLASSYPGGATPANQLLAASSIRQLCDSLGLEILGVGPFKDCERLLDSAARIAKLEELHHWFKVARILRTDVIQIPCSYLTEGISSDPVAQARDLREIADLGAQQAPPFRFAYENLCWGTYNDTWERAWNVVKLVDRDNFGMCLDTFNIAGREWADPASPSGRVENADEVFEKSLAKMVKEIDVRKVFYVQIVDAERLDRPLDETHPFHVEGQKPRMSWSRNSRLFICEEERGGYLPVLQVLRAICDEETGLGYKGWISAELFNRSLVEEGDDVPREHAERCMESWWKVVKAMGWEDNVAPRALEQKKGIELDRIPAKPTIAVEEAEIFARL